MLLSLGSPFSADTATFPIKDILIIVSMACNSGVCNCSEPEATYGMRHCAVCATLRYLHIKRAPTLSLCQAAPAEVTNKWAKPYRLCHPLPRGRLSSNACATVFNTYMTKVKHALFRTT